MRSSETEQLMIVSIPYEHAWILVVDGVMYYEDDLK